MDTEKELRKWMNRPNLNFIDRLNFGIKVWNSIEFVLLTKQEIVVDEFCNNLPKLRNELTQSLDDGYKETAWQKIVEFLSFSYSSGAVGVWVKEKLIKTLTAEAECSIKEANLSNSISNALLITLQNASIQNYYKSNAIEFARFLAINIRYLTALMLSENLISDRSKLHEEHIGELFGSLKSFIKQTPFLQEFKSAFAVHILPAICELVTLSQNRKLNTKQEFLTIMQELYFDGSQTVQLKQYLGGIKSACKTFHEIFETSMHVFLSVVEALILSFRNDSDVLEMFFRYLFNETDGKFRKQSDETTQTQLNGLTIFMMLLKKYDVPRYFHVDQIKSNAYLGKQIEYCVHNHYVSHMYEVLNLLCAVMKLDPMILEHSLCQIAVKFMLVAKKDAAAWNKYEELIFLVIEMYRKLARAEKFISQLTKNLYESLLTVKLSKKLKRSFNGSFNEASTPTKKLKCSTQDDCPIKTTMNQVSTHQDDPNVKMFEENILRECEGLATKVELSRNIGHHNIWTDIAFAFSPAICSAYTRFIGGLVSKPSLVVWKTLMFTLKDYVRQLKESDGKCTENFIFLTEITAALLTHYFMGCRLAEQSDKIWDAIGNNRNFTREILGEFGLAILNQEHNYRTMNAFLKLCYSASNFDLLCFYYRPDSMRATPADAIDDCSKNKFSIEENVKKLHCYLTEMEWTTIEQRITNFGKRECKANMNRIYLQRLKSHQLFELDAPDQDVSKYILSTAFKDSEQISDILNDHSFCVWFIGNLNALQKRTVCELLLQSPSAFDTLNRLSALNDWQLIEILTFATYKRLIEILAAGKHSDYLSTIDFEAIFKLESKKSSNDLVVLIEQQCNETKCSDRKLVQKKRDNLMDLLQLLQNLPVGFGKPETKSIVSLLNAIVYRYFTVSDDKHLTEMVASVFRALFHFGEMPNIFRNLKVKTLITLLKDETSAQSIFSLIFEKACRDLNEIHSQVLDELIVLLKQFDDNEQSQQKILLQIVVLIVGALSKDKKNRNQYDRFRHILFDIIKNVSKNVDSIVWLINITLPALILIVKAHVDANKNEAVSDTKISEEVQLMKLYLKHTVDSKNQHSVKLLYTAIENKAYFRLSDDEIKNWVAEYWLDFKAACSSLHDDTIHNTMDNVFKIISDYKSIDEWTSLLTEMEKEIEASIFTDKWKQQSKILASMAKCQYSKSKSQIFVEFFKNVTRHINMTIWARNTDLTTNFHWVLDLLECYTIITNTSQTPLSAELIDDILSFLSAINVKKIDAKQFGTDRFKSFVEQMCALCLALIQHRFVFVMDRVPHFVNVFKDLLQTICWYKSNRSQQTPLELAEITMLAEMAHSLEKTNKYFVKHSEQVKRIAPYLLLFVINLMITNDRPTTHYSQIKTHIEYICYDLIAVCDHRVEGFILRSCNEASKNIYENLHREYEKYFKFKGKV